MLIICLPAFSAAKLTTFFHISKLFRPKIKKTTKNRIKTKTYHNAQIAFITDVGIYVFRVRKKLYICCNKAQSIIKRFRNRICLKNYGKPTFYKHPNDNM